jgi:hypothetical protein
MTNVSAWKRSVPLQEKAIKNLDQQIRNVAEGRTADGHEGKLRPFSLSDRVIEETIPRFHRLFRNLAYYSDSELGDQARTALIWKGLSLARRWGTGDFACCTQMLIAAWFLAEHPGYITGKAGMAGIIGAARGARKKFRERRKQQRLDAIATWLREASNPPSRPVIWRDGEYRLENLIHPFHLWEEGVLRRNCLSRIVLDLSGNHPANTITPETLPALFYWREMKAHNAEIYALCKGSSHIGLVMLNRTTVYDFENTGSRDDYEVFARAVLELRSARGWKTAAPKRRRRA